MSIAGGHASANTHNQLMCCNGLLMPSDEPHAVIHWYLTTWTCWSAAEGANSQHQDSYKTPIKVHIWGQWSKPTMQVGVSFWSACTKTCMSSLETYPHTNVAMSMLSRGQTLHKHAKTNQKCKCCRLRLVQQLCLVHTVVHTEAQCSSWPCCFCHTLYHQKWKITTNREAQARIRLDNKQTYLGINPLLLA